MANLQLANRLGVAGNTLSYVRYIDDFPAFAYNNFWDDTTTAGFADPKLYVVQTNTKVIERCLLMTTDPGDLVLDVALVLHQVGYGIRRCQRSLRRGATGIHRDVVELLHHTFLRMPNLRMVPARRQINGAKVAVELGWL